MSKLMYYEQASVEIGGKVDKLWKRVTRKKNNKKKLFLPPLNFSHFDMDDE